MTEKKRNDQHDDSYYDELIKQRIGEALRNQSRKERLDLAQLEAWVEADRQKRRAKMKRILAIASCFIIICAGTFSLKFAFDDDAVATAGKNDNKVNEEGNNVVIKNNEEGVDENLGAREIQCSSLENIKVVKKKFPRLMEPHYIPAGYDFKNLVIQHSELLENYVYTYLNGDEELVIKQVKSSDAAVFKQYDRKLQCDYGDLLITQDMGTTAVCKTEQGFVYIIGELADSELVNVINALK